MIDHDTARRLAASGLDGRLEPADDAALEGHLAGCPACRRVADALRSDATALAGLDFGPVPVAVRADVAIAAERGGGRGHHLARWVGLAAVGALLFALLGGGALGGGGASAPSEPPGNAVHWSTDVVDLRAADLAVVANGLSFSAAVPDVVVHSDPGDATSRTLEVTWHEHGVEQRLSLYLHNDAHTWWADEIRIYDGKAQGKWLSARGRFFEAPLGQSWKGSVDIDMTDPEHVGGTPAAVHLRGATISMQRSDLVAAPAGGGIKLPQNAQPFASGGVLHCSGILQMTPKQAQQALLALGYRVSWRLVTQNGGYWDERKDPPDGVIQDWDPGVGTSGELIIAVLAPGDQAPFMAPATYPEDCPKADPNVTPPAPSG